MSKQHLDLARFRRRVRVAVIRVVAVGVLVGACSLGHLGVDDFVIDPLDARSGVQVALGSQAVPKP